ncbi:Protein kinase, partial [uncultured virus]
VSQWARCIATALRFLKHEFLVHGDIKPENILVYADQTIKLADFGHCAILDNEYVVATSGTRRYSAPEVLLKSILSHSSDIWSLGCVIYEMLTRKPLISPSGPSSKEDNKKLRTVKSIQVWRRTCGDENIDQTEPLARLKSLPIAFLLEGRCASLILSMLRYHGSARPTIEDVLEDEWLASRGHHINMNICCNGIEVHTLALAMNHIDSYIQGRSLRVPESIARKTASIYARTSMDTEIEIEAALAIAARMFRVEIADYHPLNNSSLVEKTISKLLIANQYRIHKYSMSELYIKLGK